MKIRCETEILAFPYAHILNKLLYYENAEGDMMKLKFVTPVHSQTLKLK